MKLNQYQQSSDSNSNPRTLSDEEFNELADRNPNPKFQGDDGGYLTPDEEAEMDKYVADHTHGGLN